MNSTAPSQPFVCAPFIKEIGRGQKGARSVSRADAHALYAAILAGQVSDLELGALLLAWRIKGESPEELAGFLDGAEPGYRDWDAPAGAFAPVVIPSYNGARQLPNLTPLLALLLARSGVPVLLHGVVAEPGRVGTAEILAHLGLVPVPDAAQAHALWRQGLPAYVSLEHLAPRLAWMLSLRKILGVRNSTHTVVKLLQPFRQPALRLASYTHPEYLNLLTEYFTRLAPAQQGDVFLLRGTEGEAVASVRRAQQITWFHEGASSVLVERAVPDEAAPELPPRQAEACAEWIAAVLADKLPVPPAIAQQAAHCQEVARRLRGD